MKDKTDQDLRAELMNKLQEELDSYKVLVKQHEKVNQIIKNNNERKNKQRNRCT